MAPSANPPLATGLEVGDPLPDLGWLGPKGERIALGQAAHAGRLTVVFVCAAPEDAFGARELAGFREREGGFRALGVRLFAVTAQGVADNRAARGRLGLAFPLLADTEFATGRALGLQGGAGPQAAAPAAEAWPACTLIVGPNRRVLKKIAFAGEGQHAAAALSYCQAWAAGREPRVVAAQAPALLVPDVLDRGHCARLIRAWETGERYEGGVANAAQGRNVPVRQVKVRGDVALPDLGAEAQALFALFARRLFPEIAKAYNFRVTRAETLRLGCYDAAERGHFVPHRDDTTPYTAHRRFAMSLNLNTGDYEGGYLRFPEFGPELYAPERGAAIVFSCKLLHEATPVTAGRRFVLLGFFYGEAEQALRERINAEYRARGEAPTSRAVPAGRPGEPRGPAGG